jgi:GGDEF-like domain/PucR C-terminal helix-turn-helix domain
VTPQRGNSKSLRVIATEPRGDPTVHAASMVERIGMELEDALMGLAAARWSDRLVSRVGLLYGTVPPELVESVRRAGIACLSDLLARLRTDALPATGLPPDIERLARVSSALGLDSGWTSQVVLISHQAIWEALGGVLTRLPEPTAEPVLSALEEIGLRLAQYTQALAGLASRAYERQRPTAAVSHGRILSALVARQLGGDCVRASELGYDTAGTHVGVVSSADSGTFRQMLPANASPELLVVPAADGGSWAWVSGDAAPRERMLARIESCHVATGEQLALGDPCSGSEGFRRTHAQAQDAHRARRAVARTVVRYSDVAVLAALLSDRTTATSFVARELGGLASTNSRGADLRQVTRAYLENAQNAVATASRLGCNRRTVERKIQQAEALVGHLVRDRSAELLIALQLAAINL